MGTHWEGKRYENYGDEKSTINSLANDLKELKKIGVVGVKQSFEDEGVILNDVITMRRITDLAGLELYVKIGGPEAVTDINNCARHGIDNIIAPMVETAFSLRKFVECAKNIEDVKLHFVCETKTSESNIFDMLNSKYAQYLNSVIIGRSDLTKSYDLDKSDVDSSFINNAVQNILEKCKQISIITTMGGNISGKSIDFIKKLYSMNLLDKIETRNIVIKLTDDNINELPLYLNKCLTFEMKWLRFKSNNYIDIGESYKRRAELLSKRKS